MNGQIEFSVTSECIAGHVADSWKYEVEAKVFSSGLMAAGIIAVDEHPLIPGNPVPIPAARRKVLLPVRSEGDPAQVELAVNAAGVEWQHDEGRQASVIVPVRCPGPGEPPYTIETDIPLAIEQAPGFTGGQARFTVRARLVATAADPVSLLGVAR